MSDPAKGVAPPAAVAFIGLGMMGMPMARRLIGAGFAVRGSDLAEAARAAFAEAGGTACTTAAEAATGVEAVITMLPDGKVVRETVLGTGGVAKALGVGGIVVDMSSSEPMGTQALGKDLAALGIGCVDAPVSGGVKRAIDGSLAIMAGGTPEQVERVKPLLAPMARAVIATGPLGSGHAMKALNNYVSAAGLLAACEALYVGQKFGLTGETVVDVLNASTGKNNSTEVKLKPFVLSGAFNSGFSLALMAKDLRIAADLGTSMGLDPSSLIETTARMWEAARGELKDSPDHTAIYRFVAEHEAKG